ncbi:hypothetical protein LOZ80_07975 [Paenibacillus sp. HWE-109]|uniref:hypothetical protein n=1 Tax=Paenibacillus sp. HWE-109 TaxID=1306526 RepID=UPI001EE0AE53|nr:hypothetical protein [Paenibacillus sp. HWE-109]UKS28850.1 hypothetical protein LOZ80_07975 [Paenibacillus sp. HWE-109]
MNMKNDHFDGIFDSVLTDVVKQTYSSFSMPSSEQIQLSMKKMMEIIEARSDSTLRKKN